MLKRSDKPRDNDTGPAPEEERCAPCLGVSVQGKAAKSARYHTAAGVGALVWLEFAHDPRVDTVEIAAMRVTLPSLRDLNVPSRPTTGALDVADGHFHHPASG